MEQAGHQGFDIGFERLAGTLPSRQYVFHVRDHQGPVFSVSMTVAAEYAGQPGESADKLARELGLRWVRGMIDLKRFERGQRYEETRTADWSPAFGEDSTSEDELRYCLFDALDRAEATLQKSSRFWGIDPIGIADVLGLRHKRAEDALAEMIRAGEAQPFQSSLNRGPLQGNARLTQDGVRELRQLRRDRTKKVSAPEAVLFTDIVGSTKRLEAVGDHRWAELIGMHASILRSRIAEGGGRIVNSTGDGVLAVFPSPLHAIAAARDALDELDANELPARAGVDLGYLEQVGGDVAGLTVNVAARVTDEAEPGQVLVTDVVREVCARRGAEFRSIGKRDLKGIEGSFELFEAVGRPAIG